MSERSSRNKDRAIGLGLVAAAAIGGYGIGKSGQQHSTTTVKSQESIVSAKAAPSSHSEVKPGQTKVKIKRKAAPSSRHLTKADMQPPLTPTGGDYNTAEAAAYDVTNGNTDVSGAEKLLAKIKDPKAKSLGEHAVQTGIAEMASYDVTNGNSDVKTAENLYSLITLPDVQAKAKTAINQGIAELASYDVSNGNTDVAAAKALEAKLTDPNLIARVNEAISQEKSGNTDGANNTWNDLYTESGNGWNDLYTESGAEWNTLYLHTDQYLKDYNEKPDK